MSSQKAAMASAGQKLPSLASFSDPEFDQVFDRRDAILDIKCANLSQQFPDVCLSEANGAGIVGSGQGVYM